MYPTSNRAHKIHRHAFPGNLHQHCSTSVICFAGVFHYCQVDISLTGKKSRLFSLPDPDTTAPVLPRKLERWYRTQPTSSWSPLAVRECRYRPQIHELQRWCRTRPVSSWSPLAVPQYRCGSQIHELGRLRWCRTRPVSSRFLPAVYVSKHRRHQQSSDFCRHQQSSDISHTAS